MSKERMGWIDMAKILGLIIVLMNHADLVIGPVNFLGGMFYVPIFFVLAGYTYKYRPEVAFYEVIKKKAKRLLIPYAAYNGLLFLFFFLKDSVLPGSISAASFRPLFGILYSRSYLYAGALEGQEVLMTILNGPTWFLTGLFTASLGFEWLCRRVKGDTKKLGIALVVSFVIAWGIDVLVPVLLPWSLDTMFMHVVLMGLGYLLKENKDLELLEEKPVRILVYAVLFLITSCLSGTGNLSIRSYGQVAVFYLWAAYFGSVLVMLFSRWMERHCEKAAKVLAYAGGRTMGFLCLHLFVFMFFRAGLGVIGFPADNPLAKAVMIPVTFVVLTVFETLLERRPHGRK